MQCRHKQPFAGSNQKFARLVGQAREAVAADEALFADGRCQLAIVVGRDSPGYASMAYLCDLARDANGYANFEDAVHTRGGKLEKRWEHCLRAAQSHGMGSEQTRRVLAAVVVLSCDLMAENAPDWVAVADRLASLWEPPNDEKARALRSSLLERVSEIAVNGAERINRDTLTSHLAGSLPDKLGAATRSAKLRGMAEQPKAKIASSLRSLVLDDSTADEIAASVLADPPTVTPTEPVTAICGVMGAGKTTELLRIHHRAVQAALDAHDDAPIPVFLEAREIANRSLQAAVSDHLQGLGDPYRRGVHLIVDGLDEAGCQMANLVDDFAVLRTAWPGSTLIAGTRPQADMANVCVETIEPLSTEAATGLMALICPSVPDVEWMREAEAEALRRPLFAILCAVARRDGGPFMPTARELARIAGEKAVADMQDVSEAAHRLLARIACRVVDAGGQPAALNRLELTTAEHALLLDSRVIRTTGETATFHLAVLTEHFAAHALLSDPDRLDSIASDPLLAHRWRYVLVQAMLQGSRRQVDLIMTTLLSKVPATASWVLHEAAQATRDESPEPMEAADTSDAVTRLGTAASAIYEPWQILGTPAPGDELPPLGVGLSTDGNWILAAWQRPGGGWPGRAIPLPLDVDFPYSDPSGTWCRWMGTGRSRGEAWPWHWARHLVQEDIDACFRDRRLLRHIEPCWPELAWDFACQMMDRHLHHDSAAILVADLEAVVAEHRAQQPAGDIHFGRWQLSDGEAFVADLKRLGRHEVGPPWPSADATGRWDWEFWTPEQLRVRLQQATKSALDIYQAIVDRHLPSMAKELGIYQMLPARIVGELTAGEPGREPHDLFSGAPRFIWHVEPLPAACTENEAEWNIVETESHMSAGRWEYSERVVDKVRNLRSDGHAECLNIWFHFSDPEIYSSTPAGQLALNLLHRDLDRYHWVDSPLLDALNGNSIRPRYN